MLESLSKVVEENAQQPIVQNKSIPDQFNNAAIREVTSQIISSLKNQVSQGNLQQVVSLFQTGNVKTLASNPVITTMITSVSGSLESKFGISQQIAKGVADSLVPAVIAQVIKRSNDPQDIDFDLQQMMRGMTGNYTLDISGMLQQSPKGKLGNLGSALGKLFGK